MSALSQAQVDAEIEALDVSGSLKDAVAERLVGNGPPPLDERGGPPCPGCGRRGSNVIDSRSNADGHRRRRACVHCGYRFTTQERVVGETAIDFVI